MQALSILCNSVLTCRLSVEADLSRIRRALLLMNIMHILLQSVVCVHLLRSTISKLTCHPVGHAESLARYTIFLHVGDQCVSACGNLTYSQIDSHPDLSIPPEPPPA